MKFDSFNHSFKEMKFNGNVSIQYNNTMVKQNEMMMGKRICKTRLLLLLLQHCKKRTMMKQWCLFIFDIENVGMVDEVSIETSQKKGCETDEMQTANGLATHASTA